MDGCGNVLLRLSITFFAKGMPVDSWKGGHALAFKTLANPF
jgi:hypothetical protein